MCTFFGIFARSHQETALKTKQWGIIGAATIARQYMIRAINAQPDGRVAAIMSRSPERARAFAAAHQIPRSYHRVEDIVGDADLDAIYICTTNERHYSETLAAAGAGKHVLCEKPLALSLQDAHAMAKACRDAGVVMGTNHHLRNAATHRTLMRMIQSGTIGKPLAARVFHAVSLPEHLRTWRINDPATGAGVVLDITVHDTDTLRFLLQDEVETVTAMTAQTGLGSGIIEDAVMGVMQFRGGVMAQFHDAFTVAHAGTGLEIHGTEGSLVATGVMTQAPVGEIRLRQAGRVHPVALDSAPEDLYTHAVRCFHRAMENCGSPAATAEDGIRSLAVGLAVLKAAQAGTHITVSYA